jgi:hypothetical protein
MAGQTSFPASAIATGTINPERIDSSYNKTQTGSVQSSIELSEFGDMQISKLAAITGFTTKAAWFCSVANITSSSMGTCGTTTGYARVVRWDGTLAAQIGTGVPGNNITINIGAVPTGQYRNYPIPIGIIPVANGGSVAFGDITSLSIGGYEVISTRVIGLGLMTVLSISNNLLTSIDLSGLTLLSQLYIETNSITSLNVSQLASLSTLWASYNRFTTLSISGLSNLVTLRAYGGQLKSLDLADLPNLSSVLVSDSQIASINLQNLPLLSQLQANNCQLTRINLTDFPTLQMVYLNNNKLRSIELSGMTNLQTLYLNDNQLTSINLSGLTALLEVYLNNNQLTSLDISGLINVIYIYANNNFISGHFSTHDAAELAVLLLQNNAITSVSFPSYNSGTFYVSLSNNQLTSFPMPPGNQFTFAFLSNNQISSIDATLTPNLYFLWVDGNPIDPTLDLSNNNRIGDINCHDTPIENVIFPATILSFNAYQNVYRFNNTNTDGPANVPILQTAAGVNSIYNGLPNRVGQTQARVVVGTAIGLGDPSIATAKNYLVIASY